MSNGEASILFSAFFTLSAINPSCKYEKAVKTIMPIIVVLCKRLYLKFEDDVFCALHPFQHYLRHHRHIEMIAE